MYVFAKFGVSLPHSATAQYGYGTSGSGAAGDVVFWAEGGGGITHNGIATGGGTVIHAPYPGTVVREEGIWSDGLVGYKTLIQGSRRPKGERGPFTAPSFSCASPCMIYNEKSSQRRFPRNREGGIRW